MTHTPSTPAPRARKGALAFIFVVVLLDLIGMTIIMPVAAYIVREYSTEALTVTMLTVIYSAAQFFAAPLLGKLSDRHGRRPVLLISILGSAAGYYLFGIGGALWVLFLSRLIDGFTGGNISTASAYIADITPPEERAKNFALIGAAFGLGFILGPALGGLLSQISLSAPAYAAGTLSLISAIVGYFVLPESLPKEKRLTTPLQWRDVNPFSSIWEMVRRPSLGMLLLIQCVFYFVLNARNSILAVFTIDKFGVSPTQIAALFVVGGIAMVIVQAGPVGRWVKRYGEKRVAVTSFGVQALTSLSTYLVPAFWMMFPISILSSGGTGPTWPAMGALISNSVSQAEQGKVNGVSTSLGSLMSIFGPLWAGVTYDNLGPSAPFWMSAILLVVAAVLLSRVKVAAQANTSITVQAAESQLG